VTDDDKILLALGGGYVVFCLAIIIMILVSVP
jgi:hypothetical protein